MKIEKSFELTSQYAAIKSAGEVKQQDKSNDLCQDKASLGVSGDRNQQNDNTEALAALAYTVKAEEAKQIKPDKLPLIIGKLEELLQKAMTNPKVEAEALKLIINLNNSGQLKPALQTIAKEAGNIPLFPPSPEEKRVEMAGVLADMIDAELRSKGMTPDTAGRVYKTWDVLSSELIGKVENSKIPPRGPGELSAFTEPKFVKELEILQGASFQGGNSITPLFDGPASFAQRDRLIDNAQKSIHLMTWAFYDDETGWETVHRLADKHKEGVDVKVVVDGQISRRLKHNKPVEFLEEQGIPVVRWQNPEEPYNGQHRKMLIVDGKEAIAGGINIGNEYSHKGGEGTPKWRDTDVLIKGPAVKEMEKLFAQVSGLDVELPESSDKQGGAKTAVVNHNPEDNTHHIMLSVMKAIEGASESIDIENAYFIQTPGVRHVLLNALQRGVNVRLLTNSPESIDEPVIMNPILKSLPELVDAGAEVYLKKGDTLHSKFMVVDGLFSSVGSYNLHPRSERYEGEMMVNTLDANTAAQLTRGFEDALSNSQRVKTSDEIQVKDNALNMLVEKYFFDQL